MGYKRLSIWRYDKGTNAEVSQKLGDGIYRRHIYRNVSEKSLMRINKLMRGWGNYKISPRVYPTNIVIDIYRHTQY